MVNLSAPGELIKSLGNFSGDAAGAALSFRILNPDEVSEKAAGLKALRYWGILPFAVTPDEDTIALFPFAMRPITEWPVVMAFPEGEGLRTIASGLNRFVSCYAIHSMPFEEAPEEYEAALPYLSKAAAFFGDAHFDSVRAMIAKRQITEENFKTKGYPVADPGSAISEFFTTFYRQITEGINPLLAWRNYAEKYPRFIPGWKMYLKSGLLEDEVHVSAVEAAWRIVSAPYVRDNMDTFDEPNFGQNLGVLSDELSEEEFNLRDERLLESTWGDEDPIINACRLLVSDDLAMEAKNSVEELFPALKEVWRNEDYDGGRHYEAALRLEQNGRLQEALDALRNADFWAFEHDSKTLESAIRVSKAMKDENLAAVIALAAR